MSLQVYGIPNCDTVKKARAWLDQRGIEYLFHDYKKEGADLLRLSAWSDEIGWETCSTAAARPFAGCPTPTRRTSTAPRRST